MKNKIIFFFLAFSYSICSGQVHSNSEIPLSVNTDGASPDPSSILELSSTDKGVLVPRMTSTERMAIVNPAEGLYVYQKDLEEGFYYFDGNNWLRLVNKVESFNPVMPDGSTEIISVYEEVYANNSYTVPVGHNLHVYMDIPDQNNNPVSINGSSGQGLHSQRLILKAGDIISSTTVETNPVVLFGYIAPEKVTPIYVEITPTNPYTVPAGKTLYLTRAYMSPHSSAMKIYIDGIEWPWSANNVHGLGTFFPVSSGLQISTNSSVSFKVYINGYLR